MMKKLAKLTCSIPAVAVAALSGLSTPASAQSTPVDATTPVEATKSQVTPASSGLGEILVTARRKSENQQTVPVSITNFSNTEIVSRGIVNITDVANTTSNVSSVQAIGTKYGAAVEIRGQIERGNTLQTDQSVGIYFDDLYFARPYTILSDMVDVQSVEVLKGPQGTLYGRNTTGGAIKITSVPANPKGGITGFITGSYGNYNAVVVTGAINIPIIEDKLAIRYAGSYRNHGGYDHSLLVQTVNAAGGGPAVSLTPIRSIATDNENSTSQRVSLRATPTPDVTIDVVGSYFRAKDNGVFFVTPYGDIQNYTFGNGTPSVYSSSPQHQADFRTALTDVVPSDYVQTKSLIGTAAWEINDSLTAKLIVGYVKEQANSKSNDDGTVSTTLAYIDIQADVDQRQHQTSEEFQLLGKAFGGRLNFIAGAYHFYEAGSEDDIGQQIYVFNKNATGGTFYDAHNSSSSGFINLIYSVTDAFRVNAGGRFTRDYKFSDNHSTNAAAGFPGICIFNPALTPGAITSTTNGGPCSLAAGKAFTYFTYDVGLDYRITPNIFLYAKTNNGQRSGGQQGRLVVGQPPIPFNPETVTNYEGGVKSELFDRHLRLNATYFHDNYKDIQLAVQELIPGGVATSTQNFGSAKIDGAELESELALGQFTLSGSVGYVNSKYANPATKQIYVPKWTANASAEFVQPTSIGEMRARLDYAYLGARSDDNFTATADSTMPSYSLINGRVGLTLHNGLDLAVFGKNLANKNYFTNILITGFSSSGPAPFFGVRAGTIGAPRTYGVEASYRF